LILISYNDEQLKLAVAH